VSKKATIFNIERHALHDGPGIRTLVFLKGCSMRCKWCSNPEGLEQKKQLMYNKKLCHSCFDCIKACPEAAIFQQSDGIAIDRNKCTLCGVCTESCFSDALTIAGKEMSTDEVLDIVLRDEAFYAASGGGITLSGGEPTIQAEFSAELLQKCKECGIGTAIETCGHSAKEKFASVAKYTDIFLFDIKHVDDEKHKEATGVSCELIKENFMVAAALGRRLIVRIPIVPGFNDTLGELSDIADFIVSAGGVEIVHLLPYHSLGLPKYQSLDKQYPMGDMEGMSMEKARELIHAFEGKIKTRIEV